MVLILQFLIKEFKMLNMYNFEAPENCKIILNSLQFGKTYFFHKIFL